MVNFECSDFQNGALWKWISNHFYKIWNCYRKILAFFLRCKNAAQRGTLIKIHIHGN